MIATRGQTRGANRRKAWPAEKATLLIILSLVAGVLVATETPLAFATAPGENGEITFTDGTGIYKVNPNGTSRTHIKRLSVSDTAFPAWSPDGGRLAFYHDSRIWVMNGDGTDLKSIKSVGDTTRPAWSPDGSQIAFATGSAISVMNDDGTEITTLSEGHSAGGVAWSPDGTKIAYSRYEGDYEIWIMDSDGQNHVQLTDNSAEDIEPTWSPDGGSIAFRSDRDGNLEIYRMPASGGSQTNLTNTASNEGEPTWSPNGTRLAVCGPRGIFDLPATGGPKTKVTSGGCHPDWRSIQVDLSASPRISMFNRTVTLSAHVVGANGGEVVSIYQRPVGGSESLLITEVADSNGDVATTVTMKRNIRFRAVIDPDINHPAGGTDFQNVLVKVLVNGELSRFYAKSGKYHLYHFTRRCIHFQRGCPTYAAKVTPNHAGKYLYFNLQLHRSGSWRTVLRFRAKLNVRSRYTALLIYSDRRIIGTRTRIRASFKPDSDHLGNMSPWRYFRVTA
jgi:Tol biopolymer transport system component